MHQSGRSLLALRVDSDKGIFKFLEITVEASQFYFHSGINHVFSWSCAYAQTPQARRAAWEGRLFRLLEPAGMELPSQGKDMTQIFPVPGQLLLKYLPGVTLGQGLHTGPSH